MEKITKIELAEQILFEFKERNQWCGFLRLQKFLWYFLNFSKIKNKDFLEKIDLNYSDFRIWSFGPLIPEIWNLYNIKNNKGLQPINSFKLMFNEEVLEMIKEIFLKINMNKINEFALACKTKEELREYYGERNELYEDNNDSIIEEKFVDKELIKEFYLKKENDKEEEIEGDQ